MFDPIDIQGDEKLKRTFKKTNREIRDQQRKGLEASVLVLERGVKESIRDHLRNRSGQLIGSHVGQVFFGEEDMAGVVGSELPYSGIHDSGGTIRPKRGQYLTVPLDGTPMGARADDYGDLFVWESTTGNKFLARRDEGGLELLFLLAREVEIPKTEYFTKAVKKAEPKVVELIGSAATIGIQRGAVK